MPSTLQDLRTLFSGAWARTYRSWVASMSRPVLQKFKQCSAVSSLRDPSFDRAVRFHIVQHHGARNRLRCRGIVIWPSFAFVVLACIVPVAVLHVHDYSRLGATFGLLLATLSAVLIMLLGWCFLRVLLWLRGREKPILLTLWLLVFPLSSPVVSLAYHSNHDSAIGPPLLALFSAILTLAIFGVLLAVLVFVIFKELQLNSKRGRRRTAASGLVVLSIEILHLLECSDLAWASKEIRNQVVVRLERMASAFEFHLTYGYRCSDPDTNLAFRTAIASRAQWIRSLKLWILMPLADTHQNLTNEIAMLLRHAVWGNWGEVPEDPAVQTLRMSRLKRALHTLTIIILATVPLVFLLMLPPMGIDVGKTQQILLIGGALVLSLRTLSPLVTPADHVKEEQAIDLLFDLLKRSSDI